MKALVPKAKGRQPQSVSKEERIYVASQWQLMWWKFRHHKAALASVVVFIGIYVVVIFAEFFAPYLPSTRTQYLFVPPQGIHFRDQRGRFHLRPFVYGLKMIRDPDTLKVSYEPDTDKVYELRFFVKNEPYELWGRFKSNLHFFGIKEGEWFFVLGTGPLGRDVLSRIVYAARVSLSIVWIVVTLNLSIGLMLGGISGMYSGTVDTIIQRVIEVIQCVPSLPLWMGLSAAIPPGWSPVRQYLAISVVLSLIGWTGVARVVRSKFLSTREEDYILASKLYGTGDWRIIILHLIPSFMSYVIVRVSLDLPAAIIGETALSFLGIGLRSPAVSLGVLLQQAQNIRTVALYPWLLYPAGAIIITILVFNFIGDGLRDAADPYAK